MVEFEVKNTENNKQFKLLDTEHVRIGRVLELCDLLAGLVSYRHCDIINFDK